MHLLPTCILTRPEDATEGGRAEHHDAGDVTEGQEVNAALAPSLGRPRGEESAVQDQLPEAGADLLREHAARIPARVQWLDKQINQKNSSNMKYLFKPTTNRLLK